MAGLLNIISKLFGNKYDKDIKEITPIIEKINIEFSKLSALTNDDLREKTSDFKNQITDFTSSEKQEIEEIITEVVKESKELNSDETFKSVDYGKMVAVLIKAVQEQQVQIDELKLKLGE